MYQIKVPETPIPKIVRPIKNNIKFEYVTSAAIAESKRPMIESVVKNTIDRWVPTLSIKKPENTVNGMTAAFWLIVIH